MWFSDVMPIAVRTKVPPTAGLRTRLWSSQQQEGPSMDASATAATLYLSSAAPQGARLKQAWQSWAIDSLEASQITPWWSRIKGPWWGRWSPELCTWLRQTSAPEAAQEAETGPFPRAPRTEERRGPATARREGEERGLPATARRAAAVWTKWATLKIWTG